MASKIEEGAERKQEKALKVLYPGKGIPLDCGVTAVVYPLGVIHLKKFTKDLMRIVNIATNTPLPKGLSKDELGKQMLALLVPIVIADFLNLVEECVVFDQDDITFESLPHWDLPPIVSEWLDQSFGEEKKWRPWVEAIEKAIEKVTGRQISITEMFSSLSSPQDTTSTTS